MAHLSLLHPTGTDTVVLMKSLIDVCGLQKSYSTGFALRDISFSLNPGEVLVVFGPNGAGKSTCLRILAGLLQRDGGTVRIVDDTSPQDWKKSIGYMSEEIAIWPDMTCLEQARFVAGLYEYPRNHEAEKRIDDLLHRFDLRDFGYTLGSRLSLGNRRKLSLLLSVLHDPPVLILDEPFNGLDLKTRQHTVRWISEYRLIPGRGVILATHLQEEIRQFADRILSIEDGELVQ